MIKQQLHIDFRTKVIMIIVLPLILMAGNLIGKNLIIGVSVALLPCLLMLAYGKFKDAIIDTILIILGVISQKYLLGMKLGAFDATAMFMIQMMLKMLPGFWLAKLSLQTTGMSELISSLKKWYMPDHVTIPVTVMARFFYTIKIDYKSVKNAMYMDGMTTLRLLLHPIKMFEYRIVPLLMILTRSADEVATSAVCRGLQVGKARSNISNNKLKVIDYFLIILMIALIVITWGLPYA